MWIHPVLDAPVIHHAPNYIKSPTIGVICEPVGARHREIATDKLDASCAFHPLIITSRRKAADSFDRRPNYWPMYNLAASYDKHGCLISTEARNSCIRNKQTVRSRALSIIHDYLYLKDIAKFFWIDEGHSKINRCNDTSKLPRSGPPVTTFKILWLLVCIDIEKL